MPYIKISNGGLLMTFIPGLRTKLYLGTDHLLLIEQLVLVERYKRFYFRDIQVITTTQSSRWIVFGVALGFTGLARCAFLLCAQPCGRDGGRIFHRAVRICFCP